MHSTSSGQQQPVRRSVDLRDLETRAAEIVREVRESGAAIDIREEDAVVARVIPVAAPTVSDAERAEIEQFWSDLDDLSAEISASWPEGVSAEDAINDVRREL
jgi:antitoxin (DNA-binding transcriptional repressor) of toxin-antitoxin stability system